MTNADRNIAITLVVLLVPLGILIAKSATEVCAKGQVVWNAEGMGLATQTPHLLRVLCDPASGKKPFVAQHAVVPPPGSNEEPAWLDLERFMHLDEASHALVALLPSV